MNIHPLKLSLAGGVALEVHKMLSSRAAKANSRVRGYICGHCGR